MTESTDDKRPANLITAEYRDAVLPEHAGNPLIEALPPFRSAEELIEKFGCFPSISDADRSLPNAMRMLAVSRLDAYLEPLPSHFEVIEKIGLVIRAGYTHRNPNQEIYRRRLNQFYRRSLDGDICALYSSTPSTAPSFALFGVSGVGKSTVVERALSFYPQLLLHEKQQFVQVCWLKIDCAMDGSLKQMLGAILARLDVLLGTRYRKTLGRGRTIDQLILEVAKVAARHFLGVLVIDEIQNLLQASGVGQGKMLNTLVSLANEVKIPIITVGTPRALSMLQGTFREGRRVGDSGTIIWDAMGEGEEWDYFISSLWSYQLTAHNTELTGALSTLMYELTQGIHALAVRLFQLSQLHAIRTGVETLTPELLREVARTKFRLVAPMLDALRSGDHAAVDRFEDLLHKGLKTLQNDVSQTGKLELLKAQVRESNRGAAERIRTISALLAMGVGEAVAQAWVDTLFTQEPDLGCAQAVARILAEHAPSTDSAEGPPSLTQIVQEGKRSGRNAHQAIKAAGVIGA